METLKIVKNGNKFSVYLYIEGRLAQAWQDLSDFSYNLLLSLIKNRFPNIKIVNDFPNKSVSLKPS